MAFISYLGNITRLPSKFENKIIGVLNSVGMDSITVSSTYRSPAAQAAAMYQNIIKQGIASQRKLYGPAGGKVLDTYELKKNYGYGQSDTLKAMADTVISVGPQNVSAHTVLNPNSKIAFDVVPSSVPANKKELFQNAMKKISSKFLIPGVTKGENVYHVEMVSSGNPAIIIIALAGLSIAGYIAYRKYKKRFQ
jgi:hypothetical protein